MYVFASTEKACLKGNCYTKEIPSENELAVRNAFQKLTESINSNPMDLFSYKVKSQNPTKSLQKYFGWISTDSLVYVIVGKEYSAALLERVTTDRYVLFYNHTIGKFEISHDTPSEYESIESFWVNGVIPLEIAK